MNRWREFRTFFPFWKVPLPSELVGLQVEPRDTTRDVLARAVIPKLAPDGVVCRLVVPARRQQVRSVGIGNYPPRFGLRVPSDHTGAPTIEKVQIMAINRTDAVPDVRLFRRIGMFRK